MTRLQDKLRAALRETADEIPAEAPPLHLSPRPRAGRHRRTRWHAWAAPLAAAPLVLAVLLATAAITTALKHHPAAPGTPVTATGLPPYYVALTSKKPNAHSYDLGVTAAEIRASATGTVLAKVTPPRPYVSFTGVTGAGDDRTFVLSAQGPNELPKNISAREYLKKYPHGYNEAQRFFVLRFDPASGRTSLTALPETYVPANDAIHDMALSPDGTELAADIGAELFNDHLYVFNLATGTERAWSARTCAQCFPSSGGLGYVGVNVDALSWTADNRHVAFVWGAQVRLLDTQATGANLLTSSKTIATWTGSGPVNSMWRGAIITPDGGTVLGIEESAGSGGPDTSLRERLVKFSTATGRQTAVVNDLNVSKLSGYEQVLFTSADASLLVVTDLRPGPNATILHDGHATVLPWSPYIGVAAW